MLTRIQKLFENNKYIFLFWMAFTFYMCLGYSLNRVCVTGLNIYFGADNGRAHRDLMLIEAVNHSRVSVHPLLLILLQPITLFVNGIVNYAPAAEVVTGSIAAAICVCCVYRIISHILREEIIRLSVAALYALSFSNIIFGTTPETFIYAGAFLMLYWTYVLEKIWSKTPLTRYDYILLCFFGVTSFGITITNYMSYFIGLVGLICLTDEKNRKRITDFFAINIANVAITFILSLLQRVAWGDVPVFGSSILAFFGENKGESEIQFMNFEVSLAKVKTEFTSVFTHGLFGGNIVRHDFQGKNEGAWCVFFDTPGMLSVILSIIFFIVVVLSIIVGVKNKGTRFMTIILSLALLANLCLHYIYGYSEAFIYTPHYFYLTFILIAIGIKNIKENKLYAIPLIGLGIAELVINFLTYRNLRSMVANGLGQSDSGVGAIMIKTFAGCMAFLAIVLVGRKIMREHVVFKKTSAVKCGCAIVYIYCSLILVSTISIIAYFAAI